MQMSFSDMIGVLTLIVGAATLLVAVAKLFYAIGKDIGSKDTRKKR
jgi:predicted hydrocarbon binding protein